MIPSSQNVLRWIIRSWKRRAANHLEEDLDVVGVMPRDPEFDEAGLPWTRGPGIRSGVEAGQHHAEKGVRARGWSRHMMQPATSRADQDGDEQKEQARAKDEAVTSASEMRQSGASTERTST